MSMSRQPDPIQVLIVDDHPLVREGLKALLGREADMKICGEAESATQALSLLEGMDVTPHLAVVDLSLREGNGLQLIKDIRVQHPELRVIVTSIHEEPIYAERSLRAGAMGYVHKQECSERILDAIRAVMDGRMFVSDYVSSRLLARAAHGRQALERSPVDSLSDRELQVFEMVGRGLATRKIAEALHLSPKTVDTHRQKIRDKLDLEDAAALSHFAICWVLDHR